MKNGIFLIVSMLIFATVSTFAQMDAKMVNNVAKNDIVQTAISAGNFNTLVTALTEADLVSALEAEGPYTVFAPTDDAFNKLPEDVLSSLLEDKEALKNVLLYHVVSGDITSKQILKLRLMMER
jgi:uncharacterized surface protein with fasciclin (FAS1) repeats